MNAEWELRGCVLLFMAVGVGLVVLVLLLPWWVTAAAVGSLLLAALLYARTHPGIPRRIKRHMRSWDPDVQLVVLLRVAHRPHGSHEEIELVVRPEGATATRIYRPRHDSPPDDVLRTEFALPVERIAGLRRTLETLSAWELPDQASSARDGTFAEVGLADGSRSHTFSAHMPRERHRTLIEQVRALVPLQSPRRS